MERETIIGFKDRPRLGGQVDVMKQDKAEQT